MKKIFSTIMIVSLCACASWNPKPEEMKQSNKCMVWKDGLLGQVHAAEVEGEMAKQKMHCWIWNMWGCSYTDYTYRDPKSTEILSSLPPKDKTIAKLEGNRLSVDMKGITVEPFELGADHADYKYKGIMGPQQTAKVEYNKACTKRQVALGLLTIIAK